MTDKREPLTDPQRFAVENASNELINLQKRYRSMKSGSVEDFTKEKQSIFNTLSNETGGKVDDLLREALKLPQKKYGGGSVRPNRGY